MNTQYKVGDLIQWEINGYSDTALILEKISGFEFRVCNPEKTIPTGIATKFVIRVDDIVGYSF